MWARTSINRAEAMCCCPLTKCNLVAYYKFNNACGSLINKAIVACGYPDGFGCSADHTITGCPHGGAGIIGDGYDFVPANTRLNGPTVCFNYLHQNGAVGSFNYWLNPDVACAFGIISGTANAGSNAGFNFFTNLCEYDVRIRESSSSTYVCLIASGCTIVACTWQMVTVTICEPCTTYRMYLNGCTDCPIASVCCGSTALSNAALSHKFGDNSVLNTCGYNGQMDEVSYWDKVLSAAEIQALYNCGCGIELCSIDPPSITTQEIIKSGSSTTCCTCFVDIPDMTLTIPAYPSGKFIAHAVIQQDNNNATGETFVRFVDGATNKVSMSSRGGRAAASLDRNIPITTTGNTDGQTLKLQFRVSGGTTTIHGASGGISHLHTLEIPDNACFCLSVQRDIIGSTDCTCSTTLVDVCGLTLTLACRSGGKYFSTASVPMLSANSAGHEMRVAYQNGCCCESQTFIQNNTDFPPGRTVSNPAVSTGDLDGAVLQMRYSTSALTITAQSCACAYTSQMEVFEIS